MCISVDLPEPDGPMTATSSPGATSSRDAAQRVDRGLALAVAARQLTCLDRRALGHDDAVLCGSLTTMPPR